MRSPQDTREKTMHWTTVLFAHHFSDIVYYVCKPDQLVSTVLQRFSSWRRGGPRTPADSHSLPTTSRSVISAAPQLRSSVLLPRPLSQSTQHQCPSKLPFLRGQLTRTENSSRDREGSYSIALLLATEPQACSHFCSPLPKQARCQRVRHIWRTEVFQYLITENSRQVGRKPGRLPTKTLPL